MNQHPEQPAPARFTVPLALRLGAVMLSLFVLAVACGTPALVFRRDNGNEEVWPGMQALLLGWMGVFVGQIAWFANILMPIAALCLIFRRWIAATVVTVIALGIGASTLLLYWQTIPADEGGVHMMTFEYPSFGFFFWMASMLTVLAGSVGGWLWERMRRS